ncbi:MAG: hypothetical protein RL173_1519 [Fibrobacterota bacterium]
MAWLRSNWWSRIGSGTGLVLSRSRQRTGQWRLVSAVPAKARDDWRVPLQERTDAIQSCGCRLVAWRKAMGCRYSKSCEVASAPPRNCAGPRTRSVPVRCLVGRLPTNRRFSAGKAPRNVPQNRANHAFPTSGPCRHGGTVLVPSWPNPANCRICFRRFLSHREAVWRARPIPVPTGRRCVRQLEPPGPTAQDAKLQMRDNGDARIRCGQIGGLHGGFPMRGCARPKVRFASRAPRCCSGRFGCRR